VEFLRRSVEPEVNTRLKTPGIRTEFLAVAGNLRCIVGDPDTDWFHPVPGSMPFRC